MATIIKIDSNSKDAKLFLAFARTLRFATVLDDNEELNAEAIKAIEDVEKGKTTKEKNTKELFDNLGVSENIDELNNEKESYNPAFVKMVKKAAASKNRTRVTSKNLWESI